MRTKVTYKDGTSETVTHANYTQLVKKMRGREVAQYEPLYNFNGVWI